MEPKLNTKKSSISTIVFYVIFFSFFAFIAIYIGSLQVKTYVNALSNDHIRGKIIAKSNCSDGFSGQRRQSLDNDNLYTINDTEGKGYFACTSNIYKVGDEVSFFVNVGDPKNVTISSKLVFVDIFKDVVVWLVMLSLAVFTGYMLVRSIKNYRK